jgi:hypothetical protein
MAPDDMPRIDLDPQTAERLIDGRPGALSADASGVAFVLEAARRVTTESDLSGMDATVAAMRAVIAPDHDGARAASPVPSRRRALSPLPRVVAASVAGFTVLFGGLAAAGALPSVAQNPVADIVSHVGIDLPRPASPDKSTQQPAETTTTSVTSTTAPTGDTTPTTSPTSETTVVTAPACPLPSYEGPNGCITPLPIPEPPTTSPLPTTTTTQPPPPPTTTTTTTVPSGGQGGGHGHNDTP